MVGKLVVLSNHVGSCMNHTGPAATTSKAIDPTSSVLSGSSQVLSLADSAGNHMGRGFLEISPSNGNLEGRGDDAKSTEVCVRSAGITWVISVASPTMLRRWYHSSLNFLLKKKIKVRLREVK